MTAPPAAPIRSSRCGNDARALQAEPAAVAETLSHARAIGDEECRRGRASAGPEATPSRSTNCGRMAARKMITFGLPTPTRKPSPNSRRRRLGKVAASRRRAASGGCGSPDPEAHEVGRAGELEDGEDDGRALDDDAEPEGRGDDVDGQPGLVAEHRQQRRPPPRATPRLTTNSTLGPGMMISTKAARANAARRRTGAPRQAGRRQPPVQRLLVTLRETGDLSR